MSEKNRDDKNRWRNVTIAFRMSPEENEELNNRVKLSGFRTKQDYIIQSGKYGHMWIDYIRTEYPQRYRSLVRFGELHDKAAEVNDVAYELREDIEKEWLSEHKSKQANSFVEMYRLRTQARMIAEEVVLHDVVNCFH